LILNSLDNQQKTRLSGGFFLALYISIIADAAGEYAKIGQALFFLK
jgi:hypothetical protein